MGTSRWRRRRVRMQCVSPTNTAARPSRLLRGSGTLTPASSRRCPPPPINSSSMRPVTLSTVKTSVGSCLSTLPPPPPTSNDRIYLYQMA